MANPFFGLEARGVALAWIIVLIVLVIQMIRVFYAKDSIAAFLQIPYLLWLIFATYLNYQAYLLN